MFSFLYAQFVGDVPQTRQARSSIALQAILGSHVFSAERSRLQVQSVDRLGRRGSIFRLRPFHAVRRYAQYDRLLSRLTYGASRVAFFLAAAFAQPAHATVAVWGPTRM